jgi:hypothetical protein
MSVRTSSVLEKLGHRPNADAELPLPPLPNFATSLVCPISDPNHARKNNGSFSNEVFGAPILSLA